MNPDLLEKIEDFLEHRISKAELENYATENDVQDLDEKIAWFKDSILAIEADGMRNQLQDLFSKESIRIDPNINTTQKPALETLQNVHDGEDKTIVRKINSKQPIKWLMGIAATLLLFAVGSYLFSSLNQSDQNRYAEYEYIDPGLPITMSQSDNYELYDALTYYGEENYETAEAKLKKLHSNNPTNDTLSYYLGASQLYQGKTETAKTNFIKVEKNKNSVFNDKAEWLLLVCYLNENNSEKIKESLNKILAQKNHEFKERAEKLKSEL